MNVSPVIRMIKIKIKYYLDILKYFKCISFRLEDINSINGIVIVSHNMTKSGAPLLLLYLVKEIVKLGNDVVVISKSAGPLIEEFDKLCKVFICDNPSRFSKKLNTLNENGYSKAIVNSVVSGDWANPLKEEGFKLISLVHELPFVIQSWNAEDSAKKIALNSDFVVFPSMYVKEKFDGIVNCHYPYKILTQGLYLKSQFKITKPEAKEYIDKYLGLNGNPIVLNVASGNYRKGFDIFVEMAKYEKNINFVWVGDLDKDFLYKLKDHEISNLKLIGYVDDITLLQKLYTAASVFALTSREEPFGTVVLESMNVGTPIVAFEDAGGFQDVVWNDETGYLVQYQNYLEMISKIKYILSNHEVRSRLGLNAKNMANKYDFSKYTNGLLSLLG